MPERPMPGPGSGMGPRRGLFNRNPFLIILLILGVVFFVNTLFNPGGRAEIQYSEFRALVNEIKEAKAAAKSAAVPAAPAEAAKRELARFDRLVIRPTEIQGRIELRSTDKLFTRYSQHARKKDLNDVEPGSKDGEVSAADAASLYILEFACARQAQPGDPSLDADLIAAGITYKYDTPTDWTNVWVWGLPIVFFIFILMMMFRSSRMTGENVLAFGRSRAKIVGEEKTGVTFTDVAGADEAKEELSEIVDFLKEPERFTALGGKIPKGVLLMGPPGCGKTLLARAVAGEAGVPFFSISGSDFVEMFVGVGAARVRDLFNTAKQKAPCIIFVDEIDAVGRHRGTGLGGGHDEREQTLNQLLVEMDGFDGRKGVIVIAATNRPDILDPALLRPGRFDRHVVLDSPDVRGREAILRIHARGKPLHPSVDLSLVARRTPGFSGADLANVMNEAALLAARRNRKDITTKEIEEAVERVVAGPERRSRIIGPREKRILAFHELGHALVARFTPHADPVHKVSIIPRGKGALGYTLTLPDEDRYILTKEELLARIKVMLGGRSAEEEVFSHQSTGAEDDLQKVTQLARALVCRWGMTEELGPVTYQHAPGSPFVGRDMNQAEAISEETTARIDALVREIVEKCHAEAREVVHANRTLMDRLADHLIEHEMLNLEDFESAVQRFATTPPPPLRADAVERKASTPKALEVPRAPSEPPPIPPSIGPLPQGA